MRIGVLSLCTAAALATSAGCGSGIKTSPDLSPVGGSDGGNYPAGPYGTGTLDTIANLMLAQVQRDGNGNMLSADDAAGPGALGDYYQNGGALAITLSAEWCEPCKTEQPALVTMWKAYRAAGKKVAILEILTQKRDTSPADLATLDSWANNFALPFDIGLDPKTQLQAYFSSQSTYPLEMVINTSDMSITWTGTGNHPNDLQAQIDKIVSP